MFSLESLFGDEAAVLRDENFQVLLGVTLMIPFGTAMLSPILDSLIEPFGASVGTIGLMMSFFIAPSIVVIPIAGMVADRYGRKPILAPSLVVFGLAGILIAFVSDYRVALGLRLVQGLGWAALSSLVVTSIGDLYSGAMETTAQGIHATGVGIGSGASSLVAGVLVLVGWQYPFFLYGLALPVAIAVYVWFDEPMEAEATTVTDGGRRKQYGWKLVRLALRRRVLSILVARTLPIIGFIGFLTFNSVIVVRILGGSPDQAGVLSALLSLVFATGASQVGRLNVIMGDRYRTLLGANLCLGSGMAVAFFAPNLPVAGIGAALIGAGYGISLPGYRSLLTGFAPAELRAGLISMGSTGNRLMAVITPAAMGGAIAASTPVVGFTPAVQLAGLGAGIVAGGGGLICVIMARTAPPIAID